MLGFAHIGGQRGLHFFGQFEPIGIDVGDDHVPRAGEPGDRRGHDADRARARDDHVLAEHGKRKRRVNGVSQRIEDRRHVERNGRVEMPDVGHRQREVFGESAGPIHAHADRFLAEMPPAGKAVAAASANHVPFAADNVAHAKILHVAADIDDPADELVAHDQRHGDGFLRPGVPIENMYVRAANAGPQNLDQDVVDAEFRHGHVFQPETDFRFAFNQRFHKCHDDFEV